MLFRGSYGRIWEIDMLRGIALLLMVFFHLLYDLHEFYNYPVKYYQGIFYYIGKSAALLFMVLAGISSTLSRDNLSRGSKLLVFGIVVSIVSHLWDPEWGIKFGILHFLGTSILLYLLIKRFKTSVLFVIAVVFLIMGRFITTVPYDYLFPLGFKSPGFISSDYYPLIPWFSVFLFGVIAGRVFYQEKKSLFPHQPRLGKTLALIGANSLVLYLAHQPLLLLILELFLGN